MNWYKKAQISTLNTKMDVYLNLSVKELFQIDEFVYSNKHARTAKEVLLRIIRKYPELFRMKAEGKYELV